MKKIVSISLFLIACFGLQQTMHALSDIQTEIASLTEYKAALQANNLIHQSNTNYIYIPSKLIISHDSPASFGNKNCKIEYDIKDNMFNDGKTITMTVKYLKDGKVWQQTESWTTTNPSIFTWKNAAAATATAAAIGGAAYLATTLSKDTNTLIEALNSKPDLNRPAYQAGKATERYLQIAANPDYLENYIAPDQGDYALAGTANTLVAAYGIGSLAKSGAMAAATKLGWKGAAPAAAAATTSVATAPAVQVTNALTTGALTLREAQILAAKSPRAHLQIPATPHTTTQIAHKLVTSNDLTMLEKAAQSTKIASDLANNKSQTAERIATASLNQANRKNSPYQSSSLVKAQNKATAANIATKNAEIAAKNAEIAAKNLADARASVN